MEPSASRTAPYNRVTPAILAVLFALGFGGLVVLSDRVWLGWMERLFPQAAPNLWGLISRGHMLLFGIGVVIAGRDPRRFGLQTGKTFQHGPLILILLVINCGIVASYLSLTGGTPYSGNEWLLTETAWVPLVEELAWRGAVFTLLLTGLRRYYPERASQTLAIWIGGVVFGLLHANNLLYGAPVAFTAVQVLNAAVWGVVYSFVRAKTESLYPAMVLHAAMNFVVVLF